MATAAERRRLRKQREEEAAKSGISPHSKETTITGGIGKQERDENTIRYYRTMTLKSLQTLNEYIYGANKRGIDIGSAGELELLPLMQELMD